MHFYGNNSSKTNYFVEKFVIVESSTITKYRFKNGKSVSAAILHSMYRKLYKQGVIRRII